MERFIVNKNLELDPIFTEFKIQYGEIYSIKMSPNANNVYRFKIQYGEIYSKSETKFETDTKNLKSSMERFIGCVPALFTPSRII